MSRSLSLALASIFLCILNPIYASRPIHDSDYAAVLTDPSKGMEMLISAQDGMLSVYNDDFKKMFNIAVKAASGQYTREQLDRLDIKFQQHKHKINNIFSETKLGGFLIFNQGSFSFVKNNIKYVIDLTPKNSATLSLSDDNLLSIDSAQTAIRHINEAIDNLNHWIQQSGKNNLPGAPSVITKNSNVQENNYFDSYTLYIKSSLGAESVLQSIESVRNQLINLLTEMKSYASQATSDVMTQTDRENLNMEFHRDMYDIDQIVASASFSNVKTFDDGILVVHDTKYGDKSFELPRSITFNILDDDVVLPEHANKAVSNLTSFREKLSIWLVDGIF